VLVNLFVDESSVVQCQLFRMNPDAAVNVSLSLKDTELHSSELMPDPQSGNQITVELPAYDDGDRLMRVMETPDGVELFRGSIDASP
jgi:hypothetical protein